MSGYDHSPQRYIDAKAAEKAARHKVDSLVSVFREAAAKLERWQNVGFHKRLPDGGLTQSSSPVTIDLDAVPSLEDIRLAKGEWDEAVHRLSGAIEALSSETRRHLGLS